MTEVMRSRWYSIAEMRRQFDGSFAAPPVIPDTERESVITLRVAGEAFAVRTTQVTQVARRRPIVPFPTSVPGLLGITAIGGMLVPVYDLAGLLGIPAPVGAASWLILTNRKTPVGLAFDAFEGQSEVHRSAFCESTRSGFRQHLHQVVSVDGANRGVVDLAGLVQEIQKRAGISELGKD